MSYHFLMKFTPHLDKAAAYDLCQRAVTTLCEPKSAVAHAIERYKFALWYSFDNKRPSDDILNIWTSSIFQMRFVYWPKYMLLALVGKYPDEVSKLFETQISFQNGTDQDYDLDWWGKDVPLFQNIIAPVAKMSDEESSDKLGWGGEGETPPDYCRRTLVYDQIFQALDLDNWLYGRDGQFERICMSGLTSQEMLFDVQCRVRTGIDKAYPAHSESHK